MACNFQRYYHLAEEAVLDIAAGRSRSWHRGREERGNHAVSENERAALLRIGGVFVSTLFRGQDRNATHALICAGDSPSHSAASKIVSASVFCGGVVISLPIAMVFLAFLLNSYDEMWPQHRTRRTDEYDNKTHPRSARASAHG